MTTWLLCDYGQVLSQPPPADEWAALRTEAGDWDDQDFHAAYWHHRPAYDRADLTAGEYWTRVIGTSPDRRRLDALVGHDRAIWLHPDRPALDAALAAAGTAGARLAILSNAPAEVAEGIDVLDWLDPFEARFYSCHLGAVKPEAEAYTRTLSGLRARPGDVWFFDDRPANVAAAESLGINAVLFTRPEDFYTFRG